MVAARLDLVASVLSLLKESYLAASIDVFLSLDRVPWRQRCSRLATRLSLLRTMLISSLEVSLSLHMHLSTCMCLCVYVYMVGVEIISIFNQGALRHATCHMPHTILVYVPCHLRLPSLLLSLPCPPPPPVFSLSCVLRVWLSLSEANKICICTRRCAEIAGATKRETDVN